jgi:hypothetical protein
MLVTKKKTEEKYAKLSDLARKKKTQLMYASLATYRLLCDSQPPVHGR